MKNTNYHQRTSIKAWAEEDRPREKLLNQGRTALSNAELIAILIGSGTPETSAVDLSKTILSSVQDQLHELGKLPIQELTQFKGIGEAKAITIVAALELGRRRKNAEVLKRSKITSSQDVFNVMYARLSDLPHEEFWVLLLNRANKVIKTQRISSGGVSGTVADAKLIFNSAIAHLASSIILCHNHPSGNLKPSNADVQLTKKLKAGGEMLDISVLDHLIIGDESYFSFADEGML